MEGREGYQGQDVNQESSETVEERQETLTEILRSMESHRDQIFEPEAVGRNFSITVAASPENSDAVEMLFSKESGEQISVNAFLPEGVVIRKDKEYVFARPDDQMTQYVGFEDEKRDTRGFCLSLFHELGHAKTQVPESRLNRELLIKLAQQALVSMEEKGEDTNNLTIERLIEMSDQLAQTEETLLPDWLLNHLDSTQVKSERSAWAWALHTMRNLQKDGWNVFAGFQTVAEVKNAVSACLASYEIKRFMREVARNNAGEDYTPVFLSGREFTDHVLPNS